MSVEQNIATVRRHYVALTHGDLDDVGEIWAVDGIFREPAMVLHGHEQLKRRGAAYKAAFSDLLCDIDDVVAEGDKVVTRYTLRGTHRGEFAGIPPTGKTVVMSGIVIFRVVDGVIQEAWGCADALGFMRQLGDLTAPTAAGH